MITKNKSLRKLLIVSAMPPIKKATFGGNHKYLLELIKLTTSLGIETHIVSDEATIYKVLLDEIISYGCINHYAPFCSDIESAIENLDKTIESIVPDIIHVNGHQGWLQESILGSKKFYGIPHRFFTMHLPLGSLAYTPTPLQRVPFRWYWRERRKDQFFINKFNLVFSVSQLYGELMTKRKYMKDDVVKIIPNGVCTETFAPSIVNTKDKLIIGGAGNLSNQKRFDIMIEAFDILYRKAQKGNNSKATLNIELKIAGEGNDKPKLRNLVKKLNLNNVVTFVGYVKDMSSFYCGIDIFCMSSDEEAAPYALLEAMAVGLPCVVTRVGDLPYIIEEGISGYVVDTRNSEALANGLSKVIREPNHFSELGRKSRQRILESYSSQVWFSRMKAVYENYILDRKPSSGLFSGQINLTTYENEEE
jgi:glycosyltransferase involved in cell wall biosynthesis